MSSGDSQFRYLSQLMDGIVTDIGRFLDHLPVAGFILNRDGTVLVCNERAANFLTHRFRVACVFRLVYSCQPILSSGSGRPSERSHHKQRGTPA